MRYRLFIALCVFMLGSAWAQEAGAVDAAPDGSQSAYDIFGLNPGDESSDEADTTTLVQAAVNAPVDEEAPEEEAPEEEAPAEDLPTENLPAEESSEEAVLDNEAAATEDVDGDEVALRDEIMRLLSERDSLFAEINELKDENFTLAKAAQEADGYRARTIELEAQIARLKEALALKETELAAAEARIAAISIQLEEEGARLADEKALATDAAAKLAAAEARLADAEARLAVSGGDQAAIDKLVAEKNAAIAEKESIRLAVEARVAEKDAALADRNALLATVGSELSGKDAVIEAKDAELRVKEEKIASRDAELRAKDEMIATKDAELLGINKRLAAAETDLAASKAALAEAKASLAKTGTAPAVPAASPTVPAARPDDAAAAKLAAAVADAERRVAAITAERDAALVVRDAAVAVRDAAIASREAAETMVRAAEASRAEAEAALAAALASGTVVRGTAAAPAKGAAPASAAAAVPAASAVKKTEGYLAGWSLDTSKFHKNLRLGFDGSLSRMGSWKITGQTAAQTDASQYFSRLEMPLAQGKAATLYRFKARSTGKGWIGIGLHLFVEDNRKKRGYGEGKSLLVWFTRDKASRGDDATYLQLFRSDTDIVMERMFDAELQDGLAAWRLVEIVYDPVADYIAVSVDGVLRVVYKTFFGRDAGATVSLRTLGGGGAFQDFSAWTE